MQSKQIKKLLCVVLSLSLLVGLIPLQSAVTVSAKTTKLKSKTITVQKGKKATIKFKNKNKKNKYTFKSGNKKVATVTKKGVVKGIKAGTTKITVKEIYKKKGKKKTRTVGKVKVIVKVKKKVVTVTPSPTPAPVAFNYEGLDTSWIDPSKKLVAFAFDDGPTEWSSDTTKATGKRIINALKENGQHATFFYWGNKITDANTAEIEYAKENGCEIANHTWSHPYLTKLSPSEIKQEIEKTRAKLQEITGYTSFLVRPPYLSVNDTVYDNVNVPLITCGVDGNDYTDGFFKADIIDKIKNAAETGTLENSVILLHETYLKTAMAVEELIPYLLDQGYQIVSVSELAKMNNKTLYSRNKYGYIRP